MQTEDHSAYTQGPTQVHTQVHMQEGLGVNLTSGTMMFQSVVPQQKSLSFWALPACTFSQTVPAACPSCQIGQDGLKQLGRDSPLSNPVIYERIISTLNYTCKHTRS